MRAPDGAESEGPMKPDRCRKCGAPWLRATDEHGDDDTHCAICGERSYRPSAFDRAAILADLESENRQRTARRSLSGRGLPA